MSYLAEMAENSLPSLQAKAKELGFDIKLKWIKGDNNFYDSLDLVIDTNAYRYRIQSIMRGFTKDKIELDVEAFLAAVSGNGGYISDKLIKTLDIGHRMELKKRVNIPLTEGHYKLDTTIWYPRATRFDDEIVEIQGDFESTWIQVDNTINYIIRPIKLLEFNVLSEVIKGYEIYWSDDDTMEDGYYFQENPKAKKEKENYSEKTIRIVQYI